MGKTLKYNPPKWGIYKSYESDKKHYPYLIKDKMCRSVIAKISVNSGYEKGNAEIIVRAVNSHEELVNLLKESLKYIRRNDEGDTGEFQEMIQDAIAKAEVE